ncbi:hypothetical protein JCM11641_006653 [Rhodosporidiobolus odoratus]
MPLWRRRARQQQAVEDALTEGKAAEIAEGPMDTYQRGSEPAFSTPFKRTSSSTLAPAPPPTPPAKRPMMFLPPLPVQIYTTDLPANNSPALASSPSQNGPRGPLAPARALLLPQNLWQPIPSEQSNPPASIDVPRGPRALNPPPPAPLRVQSIPLGTSAKFFTTPDDYAPLQLIDVTHIHHALHMKTGVSAIASLINEGDGWSVAFRFEDAANASEVVKSLQSGFVPLRAPNLQTNHNLTIPASTVFFPSADYIRFDWTAKLW